ncbi:hypothetical protein BV898_16912 [Hypsibius exemplaris]|uniref:NYN domain-containing protein n=1 Tax=Hypsibius exemplaris TaxID=2072580 RepID=A0A9X6RLN1_HYPEX|nr:hypothetical protein BV898_16912 [Hypsibius exemplaris]
MTYYQQEPGQLYHPPQQQPFQLTPPMMAYYYLPHQPLSPPTSPTMFFQPSPYIPPRLPAPVIMWDFDTAPVGSGGRTELALESLVQLCRVMGYWERPTIRFCYTRQKFHYPGREQAITQIRRLCKVADVKTKTADDDREATRAQIRWRIRQHREEQDGSLLLLLSGDPNLIEWHKELAYSNPYQAWSAAHICPYGLNKDAWSVVSRALPLFWWHFNFGVDLSRL